ncbi:hypothetical protein QBC35DRAFT_451245 [Podospora australis]|uniref:CFEM domain-containing protein n=1 Tax=Podospora australis TaxID=1536484 RepID=A0AAN6WYL4_9PEZI|nr:hypothetical protein QBC35DRAFT_451245 [Podospora australis]
MKVPAALFSLALATSVAAQGLELPTCAQGCANQYLRGGIGNCGTDAKCICANREFIDSIACCLDGVCDAPAQTSAIVYASSLCSAFGVTTLPTAVICSTKPTAASTTPSAGTTTPAAGGSSGTPASTGSAAETSETGSAGNANPSNSGTETAAGASGAAGTSQSTNFGPRPTAAPVLGAIGGIVAAMALL